MTRASCSSSDSAAGRTSTTVATRPDGSTVAGACRSRPTAATRTRSSDVSGARSLRESTTSAGERSSASRACCSATVREPLPPGSVAPGAASRSAELGPTASARALPATARSRTAAARRSARPDWTCSGVLPILAPMDDEIAHSLSDPDSAVAAPPAQPERPATVLRNLLTLSSLARVALARRLGMSVHDVEAVEHVMTSRALGGDHAQAVGPAELARRLGVTTAATTQALDRLERSGHVRRAPHPHDGRRLVVEVTEQGRTAVMAELGPLLALLAEEEARLDDAERAAALTYLRGQERAYRRWLAAPDGT